MTKTLAAQLVPAALALALTIAMLATTSALAGHQYRVALTAQATTVAQLATHHA